LFTELLVVGLVGLVIRESGGRTVCSAVELGVAGVGCAGVGEVRVEGVGIEGGAEVVG
jgi:hypothetical protein